MTKTGFLILTAITAALIVGAVALRPAATTMAPSEGARFFPGLDGAALDAVDRIHVTAEGRKITLDRKDGRWTVRDKGGYPATFAKVKEALVSLSQLRQFERKTVDPSRYDKLDLGDPAGKDAKSKRLTAFAGDKTVADVIVGKSNTKEILFGRSLVYVRLPDDKQSWLAVGDPKLAAEVGDWLDRAVLDVKTGRIREAVLTAAAGTDGDPPDRVIVGKDKAGDDKFRLRNMPEGREIKGERFLRYIGESLDNLTLEDVRPAGEVDFAGKAAGAAVFRTFDGLAVTAKLARTGKPDEDDKYWMTFEAGVDEAALLKEKPKKDSDLKPAAEVRKEAAAINARTAGWAYKVSSTVTRFLRYTMADILKPPPKEKAAEDAEAKPADGGATGDPPSADKKDE
ncbi:MAG: DUF4340 domain-containing protein [Rhodospirillaceae bacterium]|nr:DUF4340 domain-containing protein [Rhodospirillaceae bacterium]